MEHYWLNILNGKGVEEKKAQHLLCLRNQYKLSDYTIIDLEYQVSKRSEFKYCGDKRTPAGKIPSPRHKKQRSLSMHHRTKEGNQGA